MPNVVTNACKLFEDDAKIFADVSKRDTKLQEDIDKLCLWSDMWQLPFNETKCKCLHIGRNNPGKCGVINIPNRDRHIYQISICHILRYIPFTIKWDLQEGLGPHLDHLFHMAFTMKAG